MSRYDNIPNFSERTMTDEAFNRMDIGDAAIYHISHGMLKGSRESTINHMIAWGMFEAGRAFLLQRKIKDAKKNRVTGKFDEPLYHYIIVKREVVEKPKKSKW